MAERQQLPVLPLRDAVMFPGLSLPIMVGRPSTLRAVEHVLGYDGLIFAVAQTENEDEPAPEKLFPVGVVCSIGQLQRGLRGIQVLLQGESRARVVEYIRNEKGFLEANVEELLEHGVPFGADAEFDALFHEVRERALQLGKLRGISEEVLKQILEGVTDPGRFADLVAGYGDASVVEKQPLLEELDVRKRLHDVLVATEKQISVLEVQAQIKNQVQEELGEKQKEMYLREQLKAIHKALGQDDVGRETEELRERLSQLQLPKEAREEVERELARLERSARESMEAQVIRTYLDWIAELPWNLRSEDSLDFANATRILEEEHHGLQDVKDRVLEFLAVRQLRANQLAENLSTGEAKGGNGEQKETVAATPRPTHGPIREPKPSDATEAKARALAKGPILLFIGPPGVGKTSIARSIAHAIGRKYVRISLGGARDEADIRGHRRTYVGAMPGRIIQGMKQVGTRNPVFLLDEIDKLGTSFQGDPASALLEVLDPAQNDTFTDHYLNVPFDLSEVLFIATANFVQNIPAPLLDRMEVVEFSGYTEREKVEIAKKYLIPRQLEDSGLARRGVEFTEEALASLVTSYTHEAGVRQLERQVGAVARKIARKLAAGESETALRITGDDLRALLGRPRVHPEHAEAADDVGVATGMYYTPTGGDIMFVEAAVRRIFAVSGNFGARADEVFGNVALILTGQLGDVMKESARAALTYATTHSRLLGIPDDGLGNAEVHIHVPAGAIPKDGPSAGVAMATAIVSALSGRPVRSDMAMTGEITLRGRVLPIGGVKEKVLGAHRAGIRQVILPEKNEADLEDIPNEVRERLSFHFVSSLEQVLALVLQPMRAAVTVHEDVPAEEIGAQAS